MTVPVGFTSDLLTGLAQLLEDAGLGLTYRSDGTAYLPTEVGIGFGDIPATCERGVAITDYETSGDYYDQPITSLGIQLRLRWAPDDYLGLKNLRDATFQRLQGLSRIQFGTCHLIQLGRKSSSPLGRDENRHWQAFENYTADVNTPATAYRI